MFFLIIRLVGRFPDANFNDVLRRVSWQQPELDSVMGKSGMHQGWLTAGNVLSEQQMGH
ncbi:hypothetical protein [Dickeya sp. DW 0440]|uniref:hypothetical protein n=1 Tax=Dickeya sp. DW 0440 TaxID=1225785 RepID=UPI00039AAFC7|nr:hypothetical protein [Dickeya sp. DW 0440]